MNCLPLRPCVGGSARLFPQLEHLAPAATVGALRRGSLRGLRPLARAEIAPLFSFGHGLSYTRVELLDFIANAAAFAETRRVTISARLRNAGARTGAAVSQIYVGPPECSVPRPEKALKAFAKLRVQPNETREVTLHLTARNFAYYEVDQRLCIVNGGHYRIIAGFQPLSFSQRPRLQIDKCTFPARESCPKP